MNYKTYKTDEVNPIETIQDKLCGVTRGCRKNSCSSCLYESENILTDKDKLELVKIFFTSDKK